MKKIFTYCAAALCTFAAMANLNPERLLVVQKNGSYKGFVAERVENILIEYVDGEVKANIDLKGFEMVETDYGTVPTVKLAITRTDQCYSYKVAVVPPGHTPYIATDESAVTYAERYGSQNYYDDFTDAELSGWADTVVPDADYTVLTVGYDMYGIACEADRAVFHTPAAQIVGNPSVDYTIDEITTNSFTISFFPNDDCYGYAYCSFEAGGLDQQFTMWGPMFGFNSKSEMIVSFCQNTYYTSKTNTWTSMSPGTDYEVAVAVMDSEGNFAPEIIIPIRTLSIGGEGLAEVDIEVLEFTEHVGYDDKVEYSQHVIFTPNDQVSVYHAFLIDADICDAQGGDAYLDEYLFNNPWAAWDPYWNLYDKDDAYFYADPSTRYYAVAQGQNSLDEWGTRNVVEFTTPDANAGVKARMRHNCPERFQAREHSVSQGISTVPPMMKSQNSTIELKTK